MTKALIPAVLPVLLIVAGCGKPAEQTAKPAAPAAMENMAMPTAAKTGKATGTITAIDTATGKITLDHSPVPELQWPAMTMGFGAKREQLKGLAVGDKVAFEFAMTGTTAEISTISKQ
jgi:Cu(I)/Ag(I) efflux system periplasmic protein CusF